MKKRKTETKIPTVSDHDFDTPVQIPLPNPPEALGSGLGPEPPKPPYETPMERFQPAQGTSTQRPGPPVDFSEALVLMRIGAQQTRASWNEPNKFLTFANGMIYCTRDGNKHLWTPNQADILARDWEPA